MISTVRDIELTTTILVIAVLALLGWGSVQLLKKGVAKFWRLLEETNDRHGTCFGTSPADKGTVVGVDLLKGGALAFDRKNRKIAYITKGGKSVEILGYDFVRSWQVTWRDNTRAGGAQFGVVGVGSSYTTQDKIFLEIKTNDLQRPIIKMPMSSVKFAKESAARLDIMLNSRN